MGKHNNNKKNNKVNPQTNNHVNNENSALSNQSGDGS